MWIVPLLSWYHSTWDCEPDVAGAMAAHKVVHFIIADYRTVHPTSYLGCCVGVQFTEWLLQKLVTDWVLFFCCNER